VERNDRASVSTFYADAGLAANTVVTLGDEIAHHARVKRLDVGDRVTITNGRGSLGDGVIASIAKNGIAISVESVREVPRPLPIHLRAPIADRDRMLFLAEKATELGITSWQSVRFTRSMSVSPRGEGPGFAAKLNARMISALEQSRGAWLPQLLEETAVSSLQFSNDEVPILLDASGEPLASVASQLHSTAAVILVGPEGGISADEVLKLVDAGWRRARLAQNTLRFETAGIAAVAAIRATLESEEK
jgi:16S rRNA (uracil1498-N3)-methyltransferase